MKFKRRTKVILMLFILLIACKNSRSGKKAFNDIYYKKSQSQWISAMQNIGYKKNHFKNHILLIMYTTECAPCLKELAWWNKHGGSYTSATISLIIIEKYQASFNAFLDQQHIQLPAFRDSAAILLGKKLIPTTPVKLYFNNEDKLILIREMGINGDISQFLSQVKQQENKQKL